MPAIQVNLMQDRTNEQKKVLAPRIRQSVVEVLGAKPETVGVLLHEMAPYVVSVGGVPMAERDPASKA